MSNKDFVWTERAALDLLEYVRTHFSGLDWYLGNHQPLLDQFKKQHSPKPEKPFDHHAHSQQVYTEPRPLKELQGEVVCVELSERDKRLVALISESLQNIRDYTEKHIDVPVEREGKPRKEEKEWEIVEFKSKISGIIVGGEFVESGTLAHQNPNWENEYLIHSVRRVSDSVIFSIGDKIRDKTVGSFDIVKENPPFPSRMRVCFKEGFGHDIKNCPPPMSYRKPMFFTADGKPVYEGDVFCIVDLPSYRVSASFCIDHVGVGNHPNQKYFSTEDAAKEWVLMNKPCLSVNDVRGYIEKYFDYPHGINVGMIKELAKSKINNQ